VVGVGCFGVAAAAILLVTLRAGPASEDRGVGAVPVLGNPDLGGNRCSRVARQVYGPF